MLFYNGVDIIAMGTVLVKLFLIDESNFVLIDFVTTIVLI